MVALQTTSDDSDVEGRWVLPRLKDQERCGGVARWEGELIVGNRQELKELVSGRAGPGASAGS